MNNDSTTLSAKSLASKSIGSKVIKLVTGKTATAQPSEKDLQLILDFLGKLEPFEADTIRVVTGSAITKGREPMVSDEDLACVNRYLNFGLLAQVTPTQIQVMTHRQGRSLRLLQQVTPFLDKEGFAEATRWLLGVAIDTLAIEKTLRVASGDNPEQLTLF